jgi:hypothetical protein
MLEVQLNVEEKCTKNKTDSNISPVFNINWLLAVPPLGTGRLATST